MGFVDLHAHYLPALDDGARDKDASMQMVSAVAALGFDRLQATPHQRAGMFMPERASIDAAFAWLCATTAGTHPALQLGLGAENFWDEVLLGRLQQGQVPSYDGGPAFLFEVNPALMPPRLEQSLFDLRLSGRLPVMAHPERYVMIQRDPSRAEALGRTTALVVDLGALDGAHGRAEMKTARQLVEDGLVHAAATDIHSPDDQRAIAAGMAWIRKRMGEPDPVAFARPQPPPYPRRRTALNPLPRSPNLAPPGAPPPSNTFVKFLLKLALALTVGVVCVYLVLRGVDLPTTWDVLKQVSLPAVGLYVIILALTHVLRVSRWADLLAPIRVRLPFKDLFVISSVGFMAIQALPVRLGEFVRPYFVVRSGRSRMSAVLGTVAVERIVDGLLISIIFFASYLGLGSRGLVARAGAGRLDLAAGFRGGDAVPGRGVAVSPDHHPGGPDGDAVAVAVTAPGPQGCKTSCGP